MFATSFVKHLPKLSESITLCPEIAARALETYLIRGCVGRGVKLGSENSSGGGGDGGGGVWKSGNLEIWESGNLGIWRPGNLEIWGPGNPEIWRSGDLEI